MATSANAFLSGATSASYLNPELWSEAIEQVMRQASIMEALGVVDNRALGTAGDQINVQKNVAFTAAALTEGVATPITTLSFTQVTVTFAEFGLAKQVSLSELEYGISPVFNDITNNMGLAMSEFVDNKIFDTVDAGPKTTIYANGVTSGTISSTNVFSTTMIVDGRKTLRVDNRVAKSLVIHPTCESTLLKDDQFVDASQFGSNQVIATGQIGSYLGINVYVSNNVNSATENSVTVYKNLLLADRAYVTAWKRKPRMQWKEDSILDRAITFAADASVGVSILNSDAIVVLKSV